MVTADRLTDALAMLAGGVGLALVVMTWPRRRSGAEIARLRHPSAPPPVSILLDTSGDEAHWRIETTPGAFTTALDIVTWSPSGSSRPWVSAPFIDPIVIEPGTSIVLPTVVPDTSIAYDVVIAWTVHTPDGDVQGSRTATIDPAPEPTAPSARPPIAPGGGGPALVLYGLAGLVLCLLIGLAGRDLVRDDATEADASPAVTEPAVATTTAAVAPESSSPVPTSSTSEQTSTSAPTTVAGPNTTTSSVGTPTPVTAPTTTTTTRPTPRRPPRFALTAATS